MRLIFKILPLLLSAVVLLSCENEEVDLPIINAQDVIYQESELYKQLQNISKNQQEEDLGDDAVTNLPGIECIDFMYPLRIYVLDENLSIVKSSFISGDEQFSSFLGSVASDHSISVSFPISAVLENGEIFIIETVNDLKNSIDNCVKDEQKIGECEAIIENCVWEVGYLDGENNVYLGTTIQESAGQIILSHDNINYVGTWTPFIIDQELHLNIYIQDVSANGISDYFNYDWKVNYIDQDRVVLSYEERSILLNNRCDEDYLTCTNFNFSECELNDNPGVSEFILNNYTPCILDILRLSDNHKVSYYLTKNDAQAKVNEIPSDKVYTNSELNEVIFTKVESAEGSGNLIIEITLSAKSC